MNLAVARARVLEGTIESDPVWHVHREYLDKDRAAAFAVYTCSGKLLHASESFLRQVFNPGPATIDSKPVGLANLVRELHASRVGDGNLDCAFGPEGIRAQALPIAVGGAYVGALVWLLSRAEENTLSLAQLTRRTIELLCANRASQTDKSRLMQEQAAIVDHITDGLLLIERDGTVRYMNATAGRILNLVPAQSVGKKFADLLDFEPIIQPIFESGLGYVDRELIIDSPARHLHLVDTAVPIKNENGEVVSIVNTFRDVQRVRKMAGRLQGNHARYTFESLIGASPALLQANHAAKKAARGGANVLLNGESGVGKEVFAQAIHNASDRAEGPFIAINCAALPRDLIESELFGYTSGSFTGARKEGRPGKFESASGGTIFLDEISELPIDIQAKLLRVLQEREVVRIGDSRSISVDARIISASNRDLRIQVENGAFREDLYYRCNVIAITVPPLRHRKEDIPVLAHHFLARFGAALGKRAVGISPKLLARLVAHDWPGNIRELENCIERMVNLGEGDELTEVDFLGDQDLAWSEPEASAALRENGGGVETLHAMEREAVEAALKHHRFNVTAAAKQLGISKPTMYAKIRAYGIVLERSKGPCAA